jgi:hypothetical protein
MKHSQNFSMGPDLSSKRDAQESPKVSIASILELHNFAPKISLDHSPSQGDSLCAVVSFCLFSDPRLEDRILNKCLQHLSDILKSPV